MTEGYLIFAFLMFAGSTFFGTGNIGLSLLVGFTGLTVVEISSSLVTIAKEAETIRTGLLGIEARLSRTANSIEGLSSIREAIYSIENTLKSQKEKTTSAD